MKRLSATLLVLGLVLPATAADWPQWMGPKRDGHSPEKGLLKEWPAQGPALSWIFKNCGIGYSSPAVVGNYLYILGGRQGDEYLLCLDVVKGNELWNVKIGPIFDFKGNQWGAGPRATPTVGGGRVFALGGGGELVCVDAVGGKEIWRTNLPRNLNAEVNPIGGGPANLGWGFSWSPLLDGEQLLCYPGGPGGAVAALDPKTGNVLWRSKNLKEQATYASPIAIEVGGVRQYVVVYQGGMAGVDARNGDVLWTWEKSFKDVVIPTPLFHDDHIYLSAGYKPVTCDLVKITKNGNTFAAQRVYNSRVMKNIVAGSVLVDGHVYGYSDRTGWVCQEFRTGNQVWAEKNVLGVGSVIYADGHLYCYDEDNGEVALVEATTKGWNQKGRFALPQKTALKAVSGRNWTPPVIANGCLFLRDQELLFCYKIK